MDTIGCEAIRYCNQHAIVGAKRRQLQVAMPALNQLKAYYRIAALSA